MEIFKKKDCRSIPSYQSLSSSKLSCIPSNFEVFKERISDENKYDLECSRKQLCVSTYIDIWLDRVELNILY